MKINARVWIAVLLIVAALLMIGAIFLFRFAVLSDASGQSGWNTQAGAVRYLDKNGKPLLQWQEIDGKTYYFIPDAGIRATGWKQISNQRYYFDKNGVMLVGWQEIDGKTYYLGADGKMVSGLCTIGGEGYYFLPDGAMATGWQDVNGVPGYYSETGAAVPGWQTVGDTLYCFAETGVAMTGWNTVDDKLYYFTPEGTLLSGWQTIEDKEYYLTEEGYALTGWQELDGVRCRFGEDGAAVVGWFTETVENETKTYYFAEKGIPLAGWQTLEEKNYYFNADGVMATGWMALEGDKYYFGEDGAMAVGEIKVDGVSHFFTSKGKYVLLVNHDIPVPESFVLDLVYSNGYQVDRNAKTPLEQMIRDCRAAGFSCTINNTYRSKDTQQYLWNRSVNAYLAQGMSYEEACRKTAEDTMEPGHSEHQTGLAVDLNGSSVAYEWLAMHCWEYGFILRYPADKMEYTGVIHEPWHFRYVGVEFAMELKESGMCLEEYMQSLTK